MIIRRMMKKITALVLILTLIAALPLRAKAADNGKYISEVYVAYGKDEESAKQVLIDKGFTPVDHKFDDDNINLNREGKTVAVLGYKTTNDIRDSITDLAVMNMRGDYSVEDYKTLLRSQKSEIAEFLNEFMAVIREYRANLKAGKKKAVYVHDLLNNYTEDDSGMKMGDLLNAETLQDRVGVMESIEHDNPDRLPNLITILMQGNAMVIKSVEVLLSMAADTADNSWIDRFAELDYDGLMERVREERPELNTESKRRQYLDNVYGETASVIGADALGLRDKLNDYAGLGLHIDTATPEDIKKAFGDTRHDPAAKTAYNNWLTIGAVYLGLKYYEGGRFQAGELLDFFLEEKDPEDEEIFLPMAAALSEGQRYGLPFVSFEQLMTYAFTNEEGWKRFADQSKAGFDGLVQLSVYQNIDRDLYKDDGSVALTGAARRANNTADGTTGSYGEKMDTFSKITALSWMATLGCGAITLGSLAYTFKTTAAAAHSGSFVDGLGEWDDEVLLAIFHDKNYSEYMADPENFTFLEGAKHKKDVISARYSYKLSIMIGIVTMALSVVSAVLTIIDLCRDKNFEQLPIPKYLVDTITDADGGNYTLNYTAVECNREEYFGPDYTVQKGNCADLLADEGKQWLVLYASKNSKAGRPIVPEFDIYERSTISRFTNAVHMLGEKGAVNITSGSFRNYSTFSQTWQSLTGDYENYIHFNVSSDVKTYDEAAGNMRASAISSGTAAIIGFGGLALGAVLGAAAAIWAGKRKKKEVTE